MFWGNRIEGGDRWYYPPFLPFRALTNEGRALSEAFNQATNVFLAGLKTTTTHRAPALKPILLGWLVSLVYAGTMTIVIVLAVRALWSDAKTFYSGLKSWASGRKAWSFRKKQAAPFRKAG